jgi:hypothetical protein
VIEQALSYAEEPIPALPEGNRIRMKLYLFVGLYHDLKGLNWIPWQRAPPHLISPLYKLIEAFVYLAVGCRLSAP